MAGMDALRGMLACPLILAVIWVRDELRFVPLLGMALVIAAGLVAARLTMSRGAASARRRHSQPVFRQNTSVNGRVSADRHHKENLAPATGGAQ